MTPRCRRSGPSRRLNCRSRSRSAVVPDQLEDVPLGIGDQRDALGVAMIRGLGENLAPGTGDGVDHRPHRSGRVEVDGGVAEPAVFVPCRRWWASPSSTGRGGCCSSPVPQERWDRRWPAPHRPLAPPGRRVLRGRRRPRHRRLRPAPPVSPGPRWNRLGPHHFETGRRPSCHRPTLLPEPRCRRFRSRQRNRSPIGSQGDRHW